MLIKESWNPVVMSNDREFVNILDGRSPNSLIADYDLVFSRKFIVLVENKSHSGFWSRNDWNKPVPIGSTVRFVELPRGDGSNPLQVVASIALMAAAAFIPGAIGLIGLSATLMSAGILVAGSLLLGMFFGANKDDQYGSENPNSIYSVNSGGNGLRIGSPFAECFGRTPRYLDLVQYSYTRIEDNDQFMYFYGIVGVGWYDIEGLFIDKTPITEYSGVEYRVLTPGSTPLPEGGYIESKPTIVPDVVWTCSEISGQEVQTEYLAAIISARGTEAVYIEYDIMFNSLVGFNDDGSKRSVSVTITADVRKVDDYGKPVSDWFGLHTRRYEAAEISPIRFSNKCPAPLGKARYEFRIKRTTEPSDDSKVSDKANVIGLRAYGGPHPYYGDITCIEGKIKASDKLNGDVINKINVVAIRKLFPLTESGLGPNRVATNSIVDAISYMLTSENGGRRDESFLVSDTMYYIGLAVAGLNHSFNYCFTSQGSVMDACSKAATCSRMVPYMPGGRFCLVRDDYQEVPAMVYTIDDYDEDSLDISYAMATPDSPTCVKVNFVNSETWTDDYVIFYDDRGNEDIPYEIDLDGCTSRQQAYDHAAYLYLDMFNNGISVEFTTGLKGHIPPLFKKIAIDISTIGWNSSGKIAAVNTDVIWLSEPADFGDRTVGYILVSLPDGKSGGPYEVDKTENPYMVGGAIPGLKTLKEDGTNASNYLFGVNQIDIPNIRLMGIQPQGRDKVKMIGTIIDDSTYSAPGTTPPAPQRIPDIEVISSVSLLHLGDDDFKVSWAGETQEYKIEVDGGSGYTTISDHFIGYFISFSIPSTNVTVRVTPYYDGILQTTLAKTDSYVLASAPTALSASFVSDGVSVSWGAVSGATEYEISLVVDSVVMGSKMTSSLSMLIKESEMVAMGGPWGDITVEARGIVNGEFGAQSSVNISAPALAVPGNLRMVSFASGVLTMSWDSVAGATGYKLFKYVDPVGSPNVYQEIYSGGAQIPAMFNFSTSLPATIYVKVAATNSYNYEYDDLALSSYITINLT